METRTGNSASLEKLLADMKNLVRDGEELLKVGMSTVRQKARIGAEKTDLAVHEHPYYSMGVMFGLGLIAGILLAGSSRRRARELVEEY